MPIAGSSDSRGIIAQVLEEEKRKRKRRRRHPTVT